MHNYKLLTEIRYQLIGNQKEEHTIFFLNLINIFNSTSIIFNEEIIVQKSKIRQPSRTRQSTSFCIKGKRMDERRSGTGNWKEESRFSLAGFARLLDVSSFRRSLIKVQLQVKLKHDNVAGSLCLSSVCLHLGKGSFARRRGRSWNLSGRSGIAVESFVNSSKDLGRMS